jgi:hypothetical protein
VNAHSGLLLNECADQLAMNVVMNAQQKMPDPQILLPIGEESDATEYGLVDGEDNLREDWHHACPPQTTFVWKNGSAFAVSIRPHLSRHFRHHGLKSRRMSRHVCLGEPYLWVPLCNRIRGSS